MKYSEDHVRRLGETLAALPAITVEGKGSVTSKEAIMRLVDTLIGMRRKGYTLEMTAEALSEGGINIAPSTLRRYFKLAENAKKPRAKKAASSQTSAPPGATPPAAPVSDEVNRATRTELPAVATSSGFAVRKDTENI